MGSARVHVPPGKSAQNSSVSGAGESARGRVWTCAPPVSVDRGREGDPMGTEGPARPGRGCALVRTIEPNQTTTAGGRQEEGHLRTSRVAVGVGDQRWHRSPGKGRPVSKCESVLELRVSSRKNTSPATQCDDLCCSDPHLWPFAPPTCPERVPGPQSPCEAGSSWVSLSLCPPPACVCVCVCPPSLCVCVCVSVSLLPSLLPAPLTLRLPLRVPDPLPPASHPPGST